MTTWSISIEASTGSSSVTKSTSHNRGIAASAIAAELRRIVMHLESGQFPRFTVAIDDSIEAIMKVAADEHDRPDTATALDQIDRLEQALLRDTTFVPTAGPTASIYRPSKGWLSCASTRGPMSTLAPESSTPKNHVDWPRG